MITFRQFLLEGIRFKDDDEYIIFTTPNRHDLEEIKEYRKSYTHFGMAKNDPIRFNYTPDTEKSREFMVIWYGYIEHNEVYKKIHNIPWNPSTIEGYFDTKSGSRLYPYTPGKHIYITQAGIESIPQAKRYFNNKMGLNF